jgi:hypothetical protein
MQSPENSLKTVAIMQPTYLPWLGYFDLIDRVDCFVYLDDVQLAKRSWQVRNRVKTPSGEQYISIPIEKSSSREETLISSAKLSTMVDWKNKHLNTVRQNYRKSKYYTEVMLFYEALVVADMTYLSDLTIPIIEAVCQRIGITTKTMRSSSIASKEGNKDDLLASICRILNAETYVSAPGSADYINRDNEGGAFSEQGINLLYHQYEHPVYHQLGDLFLPYMGVIDLLFNEGFDNAIKCIREGRRENISRL